MEKGFTDILSGFAILILGGLTGHNYHQIGLLRDDKAKIPEKYRDKNECAQICASFQKSMDGMRDEVRHGFERIHDKLDQKEDKG